MAKAKRVQRIRIKPRAFDCDWRSDLLSVGIQIPQDVKVLQYSPVNHRPMPFSLDVDLKSRRLLQRTIGVMPNATYNGHIYSWDEFCALLEETAAASGEDS